LPSAPTKKLPVEPIERARSLAVTRQYTIARPAAVEPKKKARDKVVAALKRLHPMD
jgi:hypothetical protein